MSMCQRSFDELLSGTAAPDFYLLHQRFPEDAVRNVYQQVKSACREDGVADRIHPGMRVAVAVGSREYSSMYDVVKAVADTVSERGAYPFIVPAMGCHGGMTAEGQREVLAHFGITEERMGVPVLSDMETVCIGHSASGLEVHMDRNAATADLTIPVNRVKTHTDFEGKYESGLMKMMAIGLGKQHGANICHSMGFSSMSRNVYEFGMTFLQTGKIAFGLAVVENENHKICCVKAIPAEKIPEEEPGLLDYSKSRMPRIPFEKIDLLLVDQMGKDFSGTGMDTNIIGRSVVKGISRPYAERIVVFDLTEKSEGNANGMGLADITTKKYYDKLDFDATYINGMTASEPGPGRMPVIMPTEKNAYLYGIKSCTGNGRGPIRIVHIANTLALKEMFISEGLLDQVQDSSHVWVDSDRYRPVFDEKGNFTGYQKAK